MKINKAVVDPDLIVEGLRNRLPLPVDSMDQPAETEGSYLANPGTRRELSNRARPCERGPPTLPGIPRQTLLFDGCG